MTKDQRFRIRTSDYGSVFCDQNVDMTLAQVLEMLNAPPMIFDAGDDRNRLACELELMRKDLASAKAACVSLAGLNDDRKRTTAQILIDEIGASGPELAEETAQRAVAEIRDLKAHLREAVDDLNHERSLDLKQHVKRLHQSLKDEQDGNLALRREFGARDDETMHMFIERLARENDDLKSGAGHYDSEMRSAKGQSYIEFQSGLLQEIDDALVDHWVGGRLDTIKWIIQRMGALANQRDNYKKMYEEAVGAEKLKNDMGVLQDFAKQEVASNKLHMEILDEIDAALSSAGLFETDRMASIRHLIVKHHGMVATLNVIKKFYDDHRAAIVEWTKER